MFILMDDNIPESFKSLHIFTSDKINDCLLQYENDILQI